MKEKVLGLLKRYRVFLLLLAVNLALLPLLPDLEIKAFAKAGSSFLETMKVLPPIFILLGLLDVWVSRDTMIRLMGDNSGILGVLIAFLLGSAAAGPLYAAFPVAAVLLKKGTKLSNVFIMVGAWSTTKIPLIFFEASSMGAKFMLIRLALDLPGIALIAYLTEKALNEKDRREIYEKNGSGQGLDPKESG